MYVVYAKTNPEGSSEEGSVIVLDESGAFNPEFAVQDPVVKQELNKSGTLEFKIYPSHFYYNQLIKMRTKIWVMQDGVCLFYGRVLYTQKDFTGAKQVHCEGAMSYLLDAVADKQSVLAMQKVLYNSHSISPREPFDENKIDLTVSDFFKVLIATYNSKVEPEKRFIIGTVNANSTSEKYNFDVDGNTNFADLIMDNLINQVGGYMRVRPVFEETGTKLYLDWKNVLEIDNIQPIRYGINLLDVSSDESGIELYTILIPTGKQSDSSKPDFYLDSDVFNYETVENADPYDPQGTYQVGDYATYKGKYYKCKVEVAVPEEIDFEKWVIVDTRDFTIHDGQYHVHISGRQMEIAEGIAKYGKIYKAIDISNINGAQALYDKAIEHLEKTYDPYPEQITLTALDLRRLDPLIAPLVCGGYLTAKVEPLDIDRKMMCCQVTSNLRNPDKNQYVITSDLNDKGDGIPIPTKKTSGGGGGGGAGGGYGLSGLDMTMSGGMYQYIVESTGQIKRLALGDQQRTVDILINANNLAAVMGAMHLEFPTYDTSVTFDGETDYEVGDIIYRNGKFYRCKTVITNPTGEEYSQTALYNRGDYCVYEDELYECTAEDIRPPEEGQERPFDPSKWAKVNPHEFLATEWDEIDEGQYWSTIDTNNQMIKMLVAKTGVDGLEEGEVLATVIHQTAEELVLASPHLINDDVDEYDPTHYYTRDDLCQLNGRIYRCVLDEGQRVTGQFDPLSWKDVTYYSVIDLMKDAIGLEVNDQDTGVSSKLNLTSNKISMVVGDADAYDPNHAYSKGDYVVYQGKLYRRKENASEPDGNFVSSNWNLIRDDATTGYIKIEDIVDEINGSGTQVRINADKIDISAVNSSIQALRNRVGMVVTDGNNPSIIRSAIIAAINEDGSSTATIKADKIDLEGFVTATQLSAGTLQTITMSSTGSITTKNMTVNGTLTANSELINTSWDSGAYNFFAHSHSIDVTIDANGVGTVTLGVPIASASGTDTFNIADTAWYRGRVSAITSAAIAQAYDSIYGAVPSGSVSKVSGANYSVQIPYTIYANVPDNAEDPSEGDSIKTGNIQVSVSDLLEDSDTYYAGASNRTISPSSIKIGLKAVVIGKINVGTVGIAPPDGCMSLTSSPLDANGYYQVGSNGYVQVDVSGGSADIQNDDIQISGYTHRAVMPTSGDYTQAGNMKNGILEAISNGHWFFFTVSVNGTSARKTYALDFRTT